MPNSLKCRHGSVDLGKDRAKYQEGLRTILKLMERYIAKKSHSVGRKSVDRFMVECPDLVNEKMVAFLVRAGTSMILSNDSDSKLRIRIQALAEVTESLETTVRGQATIKGNRRLRKHSNGCKRVKTSSLVRFFRKRIPCSCLDKKCTTQKQQRQQQHKACYNFESEPIPPSRVDKKCKKQRHEKMACCNFSPCSERKAIQRLFICSGCMDALYCCVECQRNDWKSHSMVCKSTSNQKYDPIKISSMKDEHTETTVSDWWSDADSKEWKVKEVDTEWL